VVRSTVDSLSRNPAIFCSTRWLPSAKLPGTPANATISSDAGVKRIGFNRNARSQGLWPHRQCRQ
jgi:hypothetical protein